MMQKPSPLSVPALLLRLGVIGAVTAATVGAFAYAGGWLTPDRLSPRAFVTLFEQGGKYPGFRRNHAKGMCLSGFFDSNGNAAALSRARIFQAGHVPVTGRFALAGPNPFIADAPDAVRSMALSFKTADGQEWRMGINDIPVFIVKTPQVFYEQMRASAPDPATGKPDPAKMQAFLGAHPEMLRAIQAIKAQGFSTGFDNASYNSLDAFLLIDKDGKATPVRWSMEAVQPYAPETPDQAANEDKNYLFDAVIDEVAHQPQQWHLMLTIGQAGDAIDDATVAWPQDRQKIDAGILTIDHVMAEEAGNCRDINFDPLVLPDGIAASDDPLLGARSAAYARSFTRRAGEAKAPSLVTVPPVKVQP